MRIAKATCAGVFLLAIGCSSASQGHGSSDGQGSNGAAAPDSGAASFAIDAGPATPPSSAPDAGNAGPPDAGAVDGASPPASPFACTPAGIAAYADALVAAARQSCTGDGVGVVDKDDYICIQTPINQLAPPHPAASYNIISTLLFGNTQYPFCECTYFVQAITSGACGTAISPPGTAWTDYPLAYTFAGQSIPGYTWIPNGQDPLKVGDIPVYKSTYSGDPGHIMIVAEVVDSTHIRVAEANELNSDGTAATGETGVLSNTRIVTVDDPLRAGWFRPN